VPRKPDPDARRKLLLAARAAFGEVGVDAARIEDITSVAGLSKGSFYLHFESKEAAFAELVGGFFAVMDEMVADHHEHIAELRARIGNPTPEDWRALTPRLRAFAELDHANTVRVLKTLWRHRDVLRCILEQSGPRAHLVERFFEVSRQTLSRNLEEAISAGGLRGDLDQDLVSEVLIGMYVQLGRRMIRAAERPDFEHWARTVNVLVVEGLAVRPPGVPTTASFDLPPVVEPAFVDPPVNAPPLVAVAAPAGGS
jgi:AcrR family transcriptional regulator